MFLTAGEGSCFYRGIVGLGGSVQLGNSAGEVQVGIHGYFFPKELVQPLRLFGPEIWWVHGSIASCNPTWTNKEDDSGTSNYE